MEVHHHPQVEKKKFKEYFSEFIMIFLAVTLGFVAENIREHFGNREKERHFVKNIIADLEKDTTALNRVLSNQGVLQRSMDSASQIPVERLRNIDSQDSFYHYFLLPYSLIETFTPQQNAIQQLKSGGFSVFKNANAVDSISDLYTYYESNLKLDIDYTVSGYWDLAHAAERTMTLPELARSYDDAVLNRIPRKMIIFRNYDEASIQQLYNVIENYNGGYNIYKLEERKYYEKAKKLISYLKKQYDIR
jgi:hypothetical protein